jgi:hypothetical protein
VAHRFVIVNLLNNGFATLLFTILEREILLLLVIESVFAELKKILRRVIKVLLVRLFLELLVLERLLYLFFVVIKDHFTIGWNICVDRLHL